MFVRTSLFLTSLLSLSLFAASQSDFLLYVGTYSQSSSAEGIHCYLFHTENGTLTSISSNTFKNNNNPSYIAISQHYDQMAFVSDLGNPSQAKVSRKTNKNNSFTFSLSL